MRRILSFEREKQRLQASGMPAPPAHAQQTSAARTPAVAMFRTSPEGRFVEASPELAAMLGYADEEELMAVDPGTLYLDCAERNRWVALLEAHTGPIVFETALRRGDGQVFWAHYTSHAVRDESSRVVFHEGILEDITPRKRAEDELRARNAVLEQRLDETAKAARAAAEQADCTGHELSRVRAEMEEFVRIASHDLQEPLRTVSSFLQLLAQRYGGRLDSEGDKFIGYAVGGAARLKALIADLQGYLRLARRPEAVQPVDLGHIVGEALHIVGALAGESGATVETAELPTVTADTRQMRLVFQHLIANALKFRGDGPARIRIWAERQERGWQIAVRDEGIGLAPQHATRIFEIFKRLHLAAEYPGTGIGLAVCRKIIELHGGHIWVESQPGLGATFRFTLPGPEAVSQAAAADTAGSHVAARVRAAL